MIDIDKISSGLIREKDGIWYSDHSNKISYPEDGAARCFDVEDKSFWFLHRNKCIGAAVGLHPPNGAIFDVGGGNGFVTSALLKSGYDAVLVEPGRHGVKNARSNRGIPKVVCAAVENAGFFPNSIPAVGIFDVLEHIKDDEAFLSAIEKLLIPGGMLYITVPAYPMLWSEIDTLSGHYRRYTLRSISDKLNSCGYQIEYMTYFMQLLTAPIFLLRTLPSKLGLSRELSAKGMNKEHAASNDYIRNIMETVFAREARLIEKGKIMPFGGSCLIVARSGGA